MEGQIWDTDPEVKAELDAMAGISKYSIAESAVSDTSMSDVPKGKVKKRKAKIATKKSSKLKEKTYTSTSGSLDQIELLNIIKLPAFTSEEKYKVLEARDKLMRMRMKRNTDIASAKHIVGTCPDMCPEKERLMREVQHQVSLYEQEPGEKTMNPFLAVKQYSRSSADQEVPLPHELRPVSVLQRTMSYLLHNIVDLCDNPDVNLAEWYHFLWDRTRGIRKDITQQELCCQGSVELVEQCARFHIHCSARLVAEDLSVFDQKINTENLTKCLQTLKYMYHDLALRNESCPNEAEFRAYVILLNLNDANFMWEVQQLRREIQKSKEVQFALQVYSALDKNNYIRFFNLVRSTTYLNACILLRYFIQIRLQALTTIIKSHSPRMPYTQFPLHEMERILAFEGNASTIDFVEYHGLQLNENRTHVILDRKMFQMPELPYALDRAMNVIESKRQRSVGEVICGRVLDSLDFKEYIPHDSFDANGLINISEYIPDVDLATLQKDTEKIAKAEAKHTFDDKSSDSFGKNAQSSVFHTNIFSFKGSSDSRSNSPMDTVDKGLEIKSEPISFWSKPNKTVTSIFAIKPDNSSQSSIFTMPKQQDKPMQDFLMKSFVGQQNTSVPSKVSQTGSIFSQSSQQLDKPQSVQPTIFKSSIPQLPKTEQNSLVYSSSLFTPYSAGSQIDRHKTLSGIEEKSTESTSSLFIPSTSVPQFDKTLVFSTTMPQLSNTAAKPVESTKSLFAPTTTLPTQKSGGFTFNLQITAPSTHTTTESASFSFTQQQSKSTDNHDDRLQIQKRLQEERQFLEDNRKKQLEEQEKQMKIAAEKAAADRRRIEEEMARRKAEEEIAKRKLKEEMERKRIEEQKKLIEKKKQLEAIRRKEQEIEKRKMREMKSTILDVMEDLLVKVEDKIRDDKLKSISEKIKMKKVSRCFAKWKNSVIVNKRKRKAIDQWPIWVNWTTLKEEATELHTKNQDETLKYMKRYKVGLPVDIPVDCEVKTDRIDLQKLTRHIFCNKLGQSRLRSQHNFLKIDIFIASLSYMTTNLKWIDKIIRDLFDWKDRDELIEECSILNNKITYCIKKREGYKQESTDGYIFVGDELSGEFCEDIKGIIKNSKSRAELPIVILLQNDDFDEETLTDAISNGHADKCRVISGRYTPKLLVSYIENALLYLADNAPKTPPLELDLLKPFLHKYLASEIWKKMTSFSKWNQPYRTCLTNPEVIINLYNEAVNRLENLVFDENSMEYCDFPQVFREYRSETTPLALPCDYRYFPLFWRNESYRRKIKRVFADLTLPQFETNWPPRDVKELEEMISEFCVKFFRDPYKKIYKIIASILRSFDPTEKFAEIKNVLWTDVMEVLVSEKLKEIDFSLREPFVSQTVFDELFVVYNKDELNGYSVNTWFYVNNPIIAREMNVSEYRYEEDTDEIVIESEEETQKIDIDLEATWLEVAEERYDREEKINASKNDLREFEKLMADLEQSMTIQKQISRRFEETLTRALND